MATSLTNVSPNKKPSTSFCSRLFVWSRFAYFRAGSRAFAHSCIFAHLSQKSFNSSFACSSCCSAVCGFLMFFAPFCKYVFILAGGLRCFKNILLYNKKLYLFGFLLLRFWFLRFGLFVFSRERLGSFRKNCAGFGFLLRGFLGVLVLVFGKNAKHFWNWVCFPENVLFLFLAFWFLYFGKTHLVLFLRGFGSGGNEARVFGKCSVFLRVLARFVAGLFA